MTNLDPHSFASDLSTVLSDPSSSREKGLMNVMADLCEACGPRLGEPQFGLHAALRHVFNSSTIPSAVQRAVDINPNNAKQLFHAAKMKVLKSRGTVSDYQKTKLRNDFLRYARELHELGMLRDAIEEVKRDHGL